MPRRNKHELARDAWPVLVEAATEKKKEITYAQLANRLGYKGASVTQHALEEIQEYCRTHDLPSLTSIVVGTGGGGPSSGFTALQGDLRSTQRKVYEFVWERLPNPFVAVAAASSASIRHLLQEINADDVRSALNDLSTGIVIHEFDRPKLWSVVSDGQRFAPKAVLGVAARRVLGRVAQPGDFQGSERLYKQALGRLGFDVVKLRPGDRIESARQRPDYDNAKKLVAVKRTIDSWFGNCPDTERDACLCFFAASLGFLDERFTDRWAITFKPTHIRLNVGWVESIVLNASGMSVLVADDVRIERASLRPRRYEKAGGSRHLSFVYRNAARVLSAALASHRRALLLAGEHKMPPHLRKAHSGAAVACLWEYAGQTGPQPAPGRVAPDPAGIGDHDLWQRDHDDELAERALWQRRDIDATEKRVLAKARRGQGRYRRNLEGIELCCRVTGLARKEHLRASHIKPWSVADDTEKLDGHNGLLLSPHVDHLFDGGYVSFEDDGSLLVSPALADGVLALWHVASSIAKPQHFDAAQCVYLKYHRDKVFKRLTKRNG